MMGNYISAEQLTRRVGAAQLSNLLDVSDASEASALVSEVIERAESVVDSKLAGRYAVPVPASGFVRELALCVAERELHARGAAPDVPEKVKDAFEWAMSTLRLVSEGKGSLPSSAPAASGVVAMPSVGGSEARYSGVTGF
jgi:phage gp36-like protein